MVKKCTLLTILMLLIIFICACGKSDEAGKTDFSQNSEIPVSEKEKNGKETSEQWEKGYDLPIEKQEREEAEKDCKKVSELIRDIYEEADKGETSNVVLTKETVLEIQNNVKETGCPVYTMVLYANMENYKKMEHFLKTCMDGKEDSIIVYEIRTDGGFRRMKYIFDGTDLYVFSFNVVWNEESEPEASFCSYTRIKEWKYSKKGWFCYKLCVPEYPEVTEIVDGSRLIRVRPMDEKLREVSEKCVFDLGYQGNNLLCSNWDTEHLDKLDYNGMYEYLYAMKYGKQCRAEPYPNGIPKEEFENLIMEYLPITAEQLQEYAVFDKENQTYVWRQLGCSNYAPTFFGTSLPEVTDIRENSDGTVTLTVDAVCEMIVCDDAVITHELTIRFDADGHFQYLGNKILNDGINDIPEYQYRICGE